MSAFEEQIDKVRKYFEEQKAARYAFENTALSGKNEYIKSLYFRMLCTLIRYAGEPGEMQVLYVRRLMSGSHAENEFQDYMKMALDLDVKDVEEFISNIGKDVLRYYFCMDGSILLAVEETADKSYELLAELVEMLGVTRRELGYLTASAKAIVTQSSKLFDEAKKLATDSTKDLEFYHYVQGFYAGDIVNTPALLHITSADRSKVELSKYGTIYSKKVIIDNIEDYIDKNIEFTGCQEVVIRNCKLTGKEHYFQFDNVGTVIIEDCEISDFGNRFACFESTNNIVFRCNKFRNCGHTSINGPTYGGVLYGRRCELILFDYNELLNCYIRSNYSSSGILFFLEESMSIKVINNRFSGCECRDTGYHTKSYISGDYIDQEEANNSCSGSVTKIFG